MNLKALVCAAAFALGLGSLGGAAKAESYISFYGGSSSAKDSDLHVRIPSHGINATFKDVSWRGEPFEQPPYYGYKIGQYFKSDPNWGVELDFTHYKVYANNHRTVSMSGTWNGAPLPATGQMDQYVQAFGISHGVNVFSLNLLYRLTSKGSPSFPHGRLQPFIGAGPSFYVLHPENQVDGVKNAQKYKSSGIGWQALAGVRYGLAKRTSVFVEGKYTSGDGKVGTGDGGWAETDLDAWHVTGGVQYDY